MKQSIRAISCSLYNEPDRLTRLLQILAAEDYAFFLPWCSTIYQSGMIIPENFIDCSAGSGDLTKLANTTIWELVLQIYPSGAASERIETYEDFCKSSCIGCLIYYDCGLLEIYAKGDPLFHRVREALSMMQTKDLIYFPGTSVQRTIMHLY